MRLCAAKCVEDLSLSHQLCPTHKCASCIRRWESDTLAERCSNCSLESVDVGCAWVLTKHGGVAPAHRLGWGQRGLLGALRGGGWG